MAEKNDKTPPSPEVQPSEVREELDQEHVTHEGVPMIAANNPQDGQQHMGAMEDNVTSVMPPVTGPSDLLGHEREDEQVNSRTELTPG
jgi:hypothetical protein